MWLAFLPNFCLRRRRKTTGSISSYNSSRPGFEPFPYKYHSQVSLPYWTEMACSCNWLFFIIYLTTPFELNLTKRWEGEWSSTQQLHHAKLTGIVTVGLQRSWNWTICAFIKFRFLGATERIPKSYWVTMPGLLFENRKNFCSPLTVFRLLPHSDVARVGAASSVGVIHDYVLIISSGTVFVANEYAFLNQINMSNC